LDVPSLLRLPMIGEQPRQLAQRAHAVCVLDDELRAGLGRPREQRQALAVRAMRVAPEAPPVAVGPLDRESARLLGPETRHLQPGRGTRRAALLTRHAREGGRGSERERDACYDEEDAHLGTVAIAWAACNHTIRAPSTRARLG